MKIAVAKYLVEKCSAKLYVHLAVIEVPLHPNIFYIVRKEDRIGYYH